MRIVNTVSQVKDFLKTCKGKSIGLVPTMGYLHDGHKSLIEYARKENDVVIVSIFVNPMQFGAGEDFDNYPKDIENDSLVCQSAGADLIFNPNPSDMYISNLTYVDINELGKELCGKSRPGHFRGVCTVVTKLFNITEANKAYFGEKDAQQVAIIKKMVQDLNINVEVIGCPTVREVDGLAKSSRNKYLTEQQRKDAVCLYNSMQRAKAVINLGVKSEYIIDEMTKVINEVPYSVIDYIQIVDGESLQIVEEINGEVLVALAVKIGKSRLIDNFRWNPNK